MGKASSHSSDATWRGDQAPCVYCGQVIGRASDRCPHCRTSFSPAVRQASREILGPWFYLDPRNPSGRGVTFEMLVKMIEKGRLRPDSVVRGPTTHQDWMYAAETPRLAKYVGLCPHCFAPAKPEDTYCTSCQLNMNERPADARPGVPPDLVKAPFHQAAYEAEKELSRQVSAAGEAGVAAAVAATAAFTERPTPTPERRPPAAVAARPRPKIWAVFLLTWAVLIPLALLALFTDLPLVLLPAASEEGFVAWRTHLLGGETAVETPIPAHRDPSDPWVDGRLKEADQAVAEADLGRAIRIYEELIQRTGDATWNARIQDLRRHIAQDEKQRRLEDLRERLRLAEQMAAERRFDDALAVLRNISPEDQELLAAINISVARMTLSIEGDARQWQAEQKQRRDLASRLAEAEQLAGSGKLAEALALYDRLAADFPARLVSEKVDLKRVRADLKARLEAGAQPPPPPPPPLPEEMAPAEIQEAVKKLLDEADALDKQEKFAEALAKLEAVKKFDRKYWPDGLEEKIQTLKAKKEALEFFGMGS